MSDSVGKISLDLEVRSDLDKSVSQATNNIAKSLKLSLQSGLKGALGSIDNITKNSISSLSNNINSVLKGSMGKIKNTMQAAFNNMKNFKLPNFNFPKPTNITAPKVTDVSHGISGRAPPNMSMLTSQIENTSRALDITNAKIEQQQAKLIQLKEAYDICFNPSRKNTLEEKILKTETTINKLIGTSDKLGFKLSELDGKFAKSGNGTDKVSNSSNKLKTSLNGINNATKKATGGLKTLGNSTKNTAKGFGGIRSGLAFTMNQMFKWMIILPMIVKGLTAMATGLLNNLKTNQQFSNSLAQIKSNLIVAFTPIYQAILPAINALMNTLATMTTYVASFLSGIFGKTYQESYKATQQLIDAKTEMGAYGDSAKKTAKALGGLMGFDEINTLKTKEDDDSGADKSKVPTLVQPNLDTSAVDSGMREVVGNVKRIMKSIFTPFKQAWSKEGIATISSIKYGLDSVLELLTSIGDSMLTVWTNGTGTIMVSTILQILQTIFGIIGDIGSTFATAWNSGNIGIEIIKGIANTINNLLALIRNIGETLREAWGVVGEDVANTFMNVVNSTIGVLENLSEKLMYVWDNGGSHLFKGLIELGAKVFELAGYIYTEFVTPLIDWFVNLVAPAFAVVLNAVGELLDGITGLIDWLLGDGKPVLDTIIIVLGSFAAAWGIVTLATNIANLAVGAWNVMAGIGTTVTTIFGAAVAFLTSPFGIAIAIIGAIIAIGVLLYKNWDTIIISAKKLGSILIDVFGKIGDFIGDVLKGIVNGFIWCVNFLISGINILIKGILAPINGLIDGWNGTIGVVAGKIPPVEIAIPKVPYLAKGGIIDSPTLAMVGERGKEAVVPLENNTQGLDLLAQKILERMGGTISNRQQNSSEQPLQVILNLDGIKLAEALIKNINKLNRASGTNLIIG